MLKAIANIMSRVGRGAPPASPSPAASPAPHGSGARGGRRLVVAKFDSAKTTPENRKHWANADGLSPNAAINPEVRRVLRNRARYEVANNSYAKDIVLTLANDTIGTGPRLQMLTDHAKAVVERGALLEVANGGCVELVADAFIIGHATGWQFMAFGLACSKGLRGTTNQRS